MPNTQTDLFRLLVKYYNYKDKLPVNYYDCYETNKPRIKYQLIFPIYKYSHTETQL